MSSRLVAIRCADGRVRTISPGQKLTLGRTPRNDLRIVDKKNSISRSHAVITWDPLDDAPTLVDQKSSNGTIVNGRWIQEPLMLRNGDKLVLGQSEPIQVEFRSDLEDALAPTVPVEGSGALVLAPDDEEGPTEHWNEDPDRPSTAGLMGWLHTRASLVELLKSLEEDCKTGVLTIGDPADHRYINVRRGRVVAASVAGVVGEDALDVLLDIEGGTIYRFAELGTVPNGELNLLSRDLAAD